MKTVIFIPALLFFILFSQFVKGQTDSSGQEFKHVRLGLFYNSHINYYGRTDSLKSNVVLPVAEFWLSRKFYVNAIPVFVNNAIEQMQYNGTVATAGYQHSDSNFSAHIFLQKPFYKSSSKLVQSVLKAQATANFAWLNKILNLNAGADIKFSDKQDFGVSAGADHVFRFPFSSSVLVVDPSVYLYAGTQRFSESYVTKKNGFLLFPGTEEVTTKDVKQFDLLAYEFSVPIILGIKNSLQIICNPACIIPQNAGPDDQTITYVTLGMRVLL